MRVTFTTADYLQQPELVATIERAVVGREPFSLVRIGDGELMVLAQEKVHSLEWIQQNVAWAGSPAYCGVALPNLRLRDRLARAVRNADVVGVFAGDAFTEYVFTAHRLRPRQVCYAFENVGLPMYPPFVDLIRRYPPLLVGGPAPAFARLLHQRLGVQVPGTVPIDSADGIEACLQQMARIPHRWSLISAGCNAVVLAVAMATRHGRVAIDFGHAPDNVLSPDYPDYWLYTPDGPERE